MEKTLFITEIFYSLQGEGKNQGKPCVFVRLSGCPLRCVWCDTTYSFEKGTKWKIEELIHKIKTFSCVEVCITGGEPLAQKNVHFLLKKLCDLGFSVTLETSGALSIQNVDSRVAHAMDLKAPDSQEESKNLWENLNYLKKEKDEIKIIIQSQNDFSWAMEKIKTHALCQKANVVLSAAVPFLEPCVLAEWILKNNLPVRLQIQLHKILWQNAKGK